MPFVNDTWYGREKIILAIDIGTTYSAVSYSYLYKGGQRSITSVSNWPDQRRQAGDSKIPTLIWYNQRKKPVSHGASALVANAMEAKENGWQLAKLFKLNLHPETMRSEHRLKISDLPDGIPLTQIYSDFIQYLLKHTRHFFETRVIEGETVWKNHINSADIVITHPNGWGIHEQDFLRKAAISAGCPDPTKTSAHIRFVTEAEASVHFCMLKANIGSDWLKPGEQFAVCDAGGSTVDITTYEVTRTDPSLLLKEKRASACIQAGAIFVDEAAKRHIRHRLSDSEWVAYAKFDNSDIEDSIRRGIENFELEKKSFGPGDGLRLEVVSSRLKYEANGLRIRRGELLLSHDTVTSFFDPCVNMIVAALKKQIMSLNIKHILLVGGFGESPYLRHQLIQTMASENRHITIANDLTAKAVAEGAVVWRTQPSVNGRACRFSYGIETCEIHDPDDEEHKGRRTDRWLDGTDRVDHAWTAIATRGQVIKAKETVLQTFVQYYPSKTPELSDFSVQLYAFTTADRNAPRFTHDPRGSRLSRGFAPVCHLSADLSGMSGALEQRRGRSGVFWILKFSVGIAFGGVELQAYVEWVEKGVPKRGNVSIVPSQD